MLKHQKCGRRLYLGFFPENLPAGQVLRNTPSLFGKERYFCRERVYHLMSLEKDINQLKFRSEQQKGLLNIIYTYSWVSERIKLMLDKEDITPQQFNILRILRGSHPEPLSTLQIRERMLDKMSDTSRIVDRLILKNLVSKKICADDKRLVDVNITDKGRKLLDRLDKKNEEMDAIINELSPSEIRTLNKLLDKIRKSN